MKLFAAFALLGLLAPDGTQQAPTRRDFAYIRAIDLAPGAADARPANACIVLDASVFAHAASSLDDIRILSGDQAETPYAVTMSQTAAIADPARILNLGLRSPRHISFDLQMPGRPYSSVDLHLDAQNFIAQARITGLQSLGDHAGTYLGTYSVFDLASQKLGHRSTLDFSESTFPYLHLDLSMAPAPGNETMDIKPGMVTGAEVPASRIAQTLFTPVAETTTIAQMPRRSVASFQLPAHVPVERVTFELDPAYHANFDRPVTITARTRSAEKPEQAPVEQLSGQISRVRLNEAGQEIHEQSLSVPAILGANAQNAATVEVSVENGDDEPVRLKAVRLEMRQRKLCFAAPSQPAALVYGGHDVEAPIYDFGRLFNPADPTQVATLQAEQPNPAYRAPLIEKSLTERHPEILWMALLAVVFVLGLVAFRSAKRL